MSAEVQRPPAAAFGREERAWVVLFLALGCAFLFWTVGLGGGPFFDSRPSGYYGLQTAGFRAGHLYVDLKPHPELLGLADPYDPVANAPYRALDMAYWRGRYYLYHGVAPVVLLFWPWAAATGRYPSEPFAVGLFCSVAWVTALLLLRTIRRRHFPASPPWLVPLGGLCLLLAGPLPLLAEQPRFYEVPIACAAALQMLAWAAVFRAVHSRKHPAAWLAAASLGFGLALSARPNYLLAGLGLVFPAWWLLHVSGGGRRAWLRFGAAVALPATACGLGLLVYNRARFGSWTEFGWRYQLSGSSQLHVAPFALGLGWRHALAYLFGRGVWLGYFPFFAPPVGGAYGSVRYLPWCWFAAGLFCLGGLRTARERSRLGAVVAAVAFGTAANLAFLSCFFATVDRYAADYGPGLLLLGGIGALAVSEAPGFRRLSGSIAAALGAATILVGAMAFAARFPDPERLLPLARLSNRPVSWWERAVGRQLGGLRLDLRLRRQPAGLSEPIFETGSAPDRRDWLQITYLAGGRAELGFYHAGLGLVPGRPFAVPPGGRISLEVRCGSLLPPFGHPVFAGWTREEYERAARDLSVNVNGQEVLQAALGCYPAPRGSLRVGFRAWTGDGVADRFSGEVLARRRLPLEHPRAGLAPLIRRAPVELTVLFPADRQMGSEPLLATGQGAAADLCYFAYEGPGKVRFGFDHADSGGPLGEAVALDPDRAHRIEIWMGSLADGSADASVETLPPSRRGLVLLDGAPVLDVECRFTAAAPESLSIGVNPFPSTAIDRRFSGLVLDESQAGSVASLPSTRLTGSYGAIQTTVVFPLNALGRTEPIVVTGVSGAGDILYVRYLDGGHVSFGFDHWGSGGGQSPPIAVDYRRPHRLSVTMGSLYPPEGKAEVSGQVRVRLDGATVLDQEASFYPSRSEEIQIGKNPIGGSTCGPFFTGRILEIARQAAPELTTGPAVPPKIGRR